MIADLKPYADYKDSGLAWLGRVPGHWRTVRNGSLFGQRNQTGYAELPILEVSLRTGVKVRNFGETTRKQVMSDLGKYKRAVKGDLVYNTMRMWQGALGVCPVDGLVSPAYIVARPFVDIDPQYFAALFRTADYMAEIDSASRGIVKDRNRLYWDQFKQMQSPSPPPAEQAAIVRFLGWANGQLERAIRAKRKVIALLNEQKQVVIRKTVTQGINRDAPLKSTGGSWLGHIPQHWEISRSKRLFTARQELARPDDVQLSATQAFGVIAQSVYEQRTGYRVVKISMHLDKRRHVEADDFVISMRSFQGGLERAWTAGAIRSSYVVLKPDSRVDATYFRYLFKSAPYIGALRATADFIREGQDLNFSNFSGVDLPLIPLAEQAAIGSFLTKATSVIDVRISRMEREIDLLREYRACLIADVVTGKLDVREAALHLPDDVTPDAEPAVGDNDDLDESELTDEATAT